MSAHTLQSLPISLRKSEPLIIFLTSFSAHLPVALSPSVSPSPCCSLTVPRVLLPRGPFSGAPLPDTLLKHYLFWFPQCPPSPQKVGIIIIPISQMSKLRLTTVQALPQVLSNLVSQLGCKLLSDFKGSKPLLSQMGSPCQQHHITWNPGKMETQAHPRLTESGPAF